MRKRSFFDIGNEFEELIEEIIELEIETGEELPDDHPLAVELAQLHEDRGEKHVNSVHAIKHYEAEGKYYREIARDAGKYAKACENAVTRFKKTLKEDLERYGEVSAPAGDFVIAIHQNPQPSVELDIEPEQLPPIYQNMEVTANKEALKRDIQTGAIVNGVTLKYGSHLRVRMGRKRK